LRHRLKRGRFEALRGDVDAFVLALPPAPATALEVMVAAVMESMVPPYLVRATSSPVPTNWPRHQSPHSLAAAAFAPRPEVSAWEMMEMPVHFMSVSTPTAIVMLP